MSLHPTSSYYGSYVENIVCYLEFFGHCSYVHQDLWYKKDKGGYLISIQ